jgi:DNA-3-methyladenine glycosylase I
MNSVKKSRCAWAGDDEGFYLQYHDLEWGVPVHDDRKHFEFLVLEGAQAGLSWRTVLSRRDGYRQAYDNFNPKKVSNFDDQKVAEMLKNPAIIRNRQKILSSINNAKVFLKIQDEFGSFDNYIWHFTDGQVVDARNKFDKDIPATTKLSDDVSKDLKSRGMSFVGSTIMYAHLQATGLVNDHILTCFRHNQV